jgi:hypothetical protein
VTLETGREISREKVADTMKETQEVGLQIIKESKRVTVDLEATVVREADHLNMIKGVCNKESIPPNIGLGPLLKIIIIKMKSSKLHSTSLLRILKKKTARLTMSL